MPKLEEYFQLVAKRSRKRKKYIIHYCFERSELMTKEFGTIEKNLVIRL